MQAFKPFRISIHGNEYEVRQPDNNSPVLINNVADARDWLVISTSTAKKLYTTGPGSHSKTKEQ